MNYYVSKWTLTIGLCKEFLELFYMAIIGGVKLCKKLVTKKATTKRA